jgi:uncharacterized protein
METRSIKTSLNNTGGKLEGYAALYNSASHVLSERGRKFVEVIAPGAFNRTLKGNPDITAHWTHDEDARPPLGRTTAGTLFLSSDTRGLHFSLDLPAWASDIKEAVARGDVDGMSFMFGNEKDSWEQRGGVSYRTLHDLDLSHIAVVVRPAYPDAYAEVRSKVEVPESNITMYKAKLKLREIRG